MKVIVKGNSPEDMQVTFFITSEEEKNSFHDSVAISICQGPHKFIAHCYAPEDKSAEEVTYEIPIKGAIPF